MKLNIYNLNEDIYLNIFAFDQNIELQIMTTWFHLSNYLLLVLTLYPFKLFNAESTVFRMPSVKHTNLKSSYREIHFSLQRKEKRGKKGSNFT